MKNNEKISQSLNARLKPDLFLREQMGYLKTTQRAPYDLKPDSNVVKDLEQVRTGLNARESKASEESSPPSNTPSSATSSTKPRRSSSNWSTPKDLSST